MPETLMVRVCAAILLLDEFNEESVRMLPERLQLAVAATPDPVNLAQLLADQVCRIALGNYILILPLLDIGSPITRLKMYEVF